MPSDRRFTLERTVSGVLKDLDAAF